MASRLSQEGFTLIELLIVLAIIIIGLTIGVPSFSDSLLKGKLASESTRFVSAIRFARTEAINRGAHVILISQGASGVWDSGWRLVADNNNNNVEDTGDTILAIGKIQNKITIRSSSSLNDWFGYDENGYGITSSNTSGGTLLFCSTDPTKTRSLTLTISVSGLASTARGNAC